MPVQGVSGELIGLLARKLFTTYASKPALVLQIGDLLLGTSKIQKGIELLLKLNELKLGGATEASEFNPGMIDELMAVIKRLQDDSSELKGDGILGAKTLRFLLNKRFGHYHRPKESLPTSPTQGTPGDGIHAIRYFIELDKLPDVPGGDALQLLSEAWFSWAKVCNIDVKHAKNSTEANVLIRVRPINEQPPSVVALADVGPPDGRQLDLSFDSNETWDAHKLEATAAHEIGHLLGIHHISAKRQLMNDTLSDIKTPQTEDIAAARKIWGQRS